MFGSNLQNETVTINRIWLCGLFLAQYWVSSWFFWYFFECEISLRSIYFLLNEIPNTAGVAYWCDDIEKNI